MNSLVGVLRENSPFQWWVLMICLQLATVADQSTALYTNPRHILSKRSTDGSVEINSKQQADHPAGTVLVSAEHYDEDLDHIKDQQKLTTDTEIVPDDHQRITLRQVNNNDVNRAMEEVFHSEDTVKQGKSETFPKSSRENQYRQKNSPIKMIVEKTPPRKGETIRNFYYEPYRSVRSSNKLFQELGDHRNSEEIINRIIGTRRNNTDSANKNLLKNAYLTKFTTYNITQLDHKRSKVFLFEKKDNSSTNISYLDSKNRSTNYSDNHSASLKTVLEPGNEIQEDTESSQRKEDASIKTPTKTHHFSGDQFAKEALNHINNPSTDLLSYFTDHDHDHEKHYRTDTDESERGKISPEYIRAGQSDTEGLLNYPTGFVGGQFMLKQDTPNVVLSDFSLPCNHQKGPSEFVGGQFIEESEKKVLEKSNGPGTLHDFVGGQFIDHHGNQGNMVGGLPTDISGGKTAKDFVGGQFLEDFEKSKSRAPNSEIEKRPAIFVGGQFVDETSNNNNDDENEKMGSSSFVGGKFIHEEMKTESIDTIIQTTVIPKVASGLEFETFGLATDDNFDENNEKGKPSLKEQKVITSVDQAQIDLPLIQKEENNDNMTSKGLYLSEQHKNTPPELQNPLKDLAFYYDKDKEPIPYYDGFPTRFTSPLPENEYLNPNDHKNHQEIKCVPKIVSNKNQSHKKEVLTTHQVQETLEGMITTMSILGDPQIKNGVKKEDPIHNDKAKTLPLKEVKENDDYGTIYKKYETILPYRMSPDTIPTNIFPEVKKIEEVQLTEKTNNGNEPLVTLSPNSKDNVIFKTDDGDTEVIVSVSSSSDNKIQNPEATEIFGPYEIHESFNKSNIDQETITEFVGLVGLSTTIRPIDVNDANITLDSEYDGYLEEDRTLGSSNVNESHSILEKDPESNYYVTELVGNYLPSHTQEPTSIKDIVSAHSGDLEVASSASPVSSDVMVDNIVGGSSDMLPSLFNSNSATSSSLPYNDENVPDIDEKTNGVPTTSEIYSDTTQMIEDVELYAGNQHNIIFGNENTPYLDHLNIHETEHPNENNKSKDGHLAELCIPLTNEKYISLLDLLSGPFYIDKNGKKVAMTFRRDRKKNCNLNSKQCKLFVDLKNISNSLKAESSMELIKDDDLSSPKTKHEKRHIVEEELTTDFKKSYQFPKPEKTDNKVLGMQINEERLNSDQQFSNGLTEDGISFATYKEGPRKRQVLRFTSDKPSAIFDFHPSLAPISNKISLGNFSSKSNEKWNDLFNFDSGAGHDGQGGSEDNPNKQFLDPQRKRPARMIDLGRSNQGEKCGCGENEVLKSASPIPNYKQFVAKRFDILKNIVHTVGDWAADS